MQNKSLRKSLALAKHVAYEAHRNDFDMLTMEEKVICERCEQAVHIKEARKGTDFHRYTLQAFTE